MKVNYSGIELADGTTADANDVMRLFNYLKTVLSNLGSDNFGDAQLLNSARHGHLGTGSKAHNIGDIYQGLVPCGYSYRASTPGSCYVTVPANTCSSSGGILVLMGATLSISSGTDIHVPLNFQNSLGTAADLSASGAGFDPRFELYLEFTGTIKTRQIASMLINSVTVPTIGGGFDETLAMTVKIGTAYSGGGGTASEYSLDVYAF